MYGLAENALAQEAEFHLDLNEAEAAELDRRIDALFDWHSKVMLPRYAGFLNAQADLIDSGKLDHGMIAASVVELRRIFEELVAGAAPYTAEILVNHTAPEKVRFLEARMAERLAERKEELEEPAEERLEARIERMTENFERVTGPLKPGQIDIIRRYAIKTAGADEAWLRTRANRQRAFTAFLSQQPDKAQISAFVYKILLRPYEIVDPEYKAVSEARWKRFQALLETMMASLSAEQRNHMSATFRRYASDMLELST